VRASLADTYAEGVLWHDTAPEPAVDETPPPAEVDVVIVGGGYCGLSAAAELARRGRSVAVLDRERLGWGASTRNGGMVLPELKAGPGELAAEYGDLGTRMHEAVEEAFDHLESLVATAGIDCSYERTGRLELAHGPRSAARLRALAAEHDAIGSPARLVEGDDLAAEIGSTAYVAGLVVERGGGIHPARLHAGLVDLARRAGATLHPHCAVEAIDGPIVRTSQGSVRAGDVLLAVNAYVDRAAPHLRRRVLPMGSFIIATEPLGAELATSVLPTRRMVYDVQNLLSYWRLDPDGRMVFGGRQRLGRVRIAEARDHLYERMVRIHPQLEGTRVVRAWGGDVALTLDRLPHCGRIDGAWYAAGCNGSGVALNTWLGHRMAAAMCGEALPPFAELAHRRVPLRSLRAAWLPLASLWFRWQDSRG
jgi:glycine/D-amino acid oxidase-like deaminating enzyme